MGVFDSGDGVFAGVGLLETVSTGRSRLGVGVPGAAEVSGADSACGVGCPAGSPLGDADVLGCGLPWFAGSAGVGVSCRTVGSVWVGVSVRSVCPSVLTVVAVGFCG